MNQESVTSQIEARAKAWAGAADAIADDVASAAGLVIESLAAGGKLLLFGNGGSAADAQHVAAEFVVRFRKDRQAYAAVALTTDTSVLTACANDYGYEQVFSRQVEALLSAGDVVIALSTSGRSKNVIEAVRVAREMGGKTVSCIGSDLDSPLKELSDVTISVPVSTTDQIQEMHSAALHILCDRVEEALS